MRSSWPVAFVIAGVHCQDLRADFLSVTVLTRRRFGNSVCPCDLDLDLSAEDRVSDIRGGIFHRV